MKIFITGGTGFVGTNLAREFAGQGHHVTVLGRTLKNKADYPPSVSFIKADSTVKGSWQEEAAKHEIFINLAGTSIFSRWNDKIKSAIRQSRILTTTNLVEAMSHSKSTAVRLFSASAVGYYGFHEDGEITEEAPPGDDFLAFVTRDWEASAKKAADYGVKVIICRFGIVLGRSGGALQQMLPSYKSYLGAPLGTGRQWFSWVHEQDLINIFLFLIHQQDIEGVFNCCAPHPVRNTEMTRAIGKALGVPTLPFKIPSFMMKIILGEFGNVLLKGQKVIPTRLTNLNFTFRFQTIQEALSNLLSK